MIEKLTIIIPFKNASPYIQINRDALLRQITYHPEVRIIYVNDGSTDDSTKAVDDIDNKNVKLVSKTHNNPYLCRNDLAFGCQSEYVAFVDADVLIAPDWISKILECINASSPNLIVGPCLTDDHKSFFLKMYNSYQTVSMKVRFRYKPIDFFSGYGGNMIFKKEVFESLSGFSENRRGSDAAITKKYLLRYGSEKIMYDPSLYVTHLEISSVADLIRKIRLYRTGSYNHPEEHKNKQMTLDLQYQILREWVGSDRKRWWILPILIGMILFDDINRRLKR